MRVLPSIHLSCQFLILFLDARRSSAWPADKVQFKRPTRGDFREQVTARSGSKLTDADVNIENRNRESAENSNKRELIPTHRSVAVFALYEGQKRGGTYAIRHLESNADYLHLDGRDRSFARLVLTTAERHMGQIDKVLMGFINNNNTFFKVNFLIMQRKLGRKL